MNKLLEIKNLRVTFPKKDLLGVALDRLSLSLSEAESLGLVGESGAGKSLMSLAILNLLPKEALVQSGEILFEGENLLKLDEKQMLKIRGDKISMIFQEPMTALNPLFKIGNQIEEVLRLHRKDQPDKKKMVISLLEKLHIPDPERVYNSYPHQLSGGLRQRAMIAIALILKPKLILADEPTTALDVTIQSEIIDLILDIQREFRSAFIIISHDIGVVAKLASRISVIYSGEIVESATKDQLLSAPKHPYTIGLLSSVRSKEKGKKRFEEIKGDPPNIFFLPKGCRFHPRCKEAIDICNNLNPPSFTVETSEVRCWLYQNGDLKNQ